MYVSVDSNNLVHRYRAVMTEERKYIPVTKLNNNHDQNQGAHQVQ